MGQRARSRERKARSRVRARASEAGFTIVETLVATLLVSVGLATAFQALNVSTHLSADVRAREGGVTFARQITEGARSIPFSQIAGTTIVAQLQALPGLASTSTGSTWTIFRNGSNYTVTASVTTLTDPTDTSG